MGILNITDKENVGGWKSIHIATLNEIVSTPDLLTNNNASQISINQLPSSLEIYPVAESIKITETPKLSASGISYSLKINIDFYYTSSEIDDYLNAYLHKKVIVIGKKNSGTEKIYGSKNHPLKFSYTLLEGQSFEDGAKIKVTISATTIQKPVFISD